MGATDTWVILDPTGEVLLICSGADAVDVVDEWRSRGYQAARLEADTVTAA